MSIKKFNDFENPLNEGFMGLKHWTDSDNTSDFMRKVMKNVI